MIGILAGWVRHRVFYPIFHIHSSDAAEAEVEVVSGQAGRRLSTGIDWPSRAYTHTVSGWLSFSVPRVSKTDGTGADMGQHPLHEGEW